ncbi:MAG: lipopolysaccharide transport periplasmic protein LptA [Gallionella sp.]|nr:lipopolysaccharide transport periplasmic protein LptA [Gallionella sp.]
MRQTNNRFLMALLPLFLSLWAPACFAERADHEKPITLEADQVLVDDAQQISTFTGNVRLSQGSLLIRGDKIVVTQDKNGFKYATAYGNTAEFRQKREGYDGQVEGYAERIVYDTQAETLDLYKQARLKRDRDEVRGEHITYSAKTEIFQVGGSDASSGDTPPQRVRAVLQPKTKDHAAPAPDAITNSFDENLVPAK